MNSSEVLRSSASPEGARLYVGPKAPKNGRIHHKLGILNATLQIDDYSFPARVHSGFGTVLCFETEDGFNYQAFKNGDTYNNDHGGIALMVIPPSDANNDYCHISLAPPAYSALMRSRDPIFQLQAIGEKSPNVFFAAALKRLVECAELLTSRNCDLGVSINAIRTIISAVPKSHASFFDKLPTLEPSQDLEARRMACLALCHSTIGIIEGILNYPKPAQILTSHPSAKWMPIHNPLAKPTALGASLFCFLALLPDLPYGYFWILRLVVCAAAIFCATDQFRMNRNDLAWGCVVLGIVFNPIVKVQFGRELWMLVDVLAGAFLCLVAFNSKASPSTSKSKGI